MEIIDYHTAADQAIRTAEACAAEGDQTAATFQIHKAIAYALLALGEDVQNISLTCLGGE